MIALSTENNFYYRNDKNLLLFRLLAALGGSRYIGLHDGALAPTLFYGISHLINLR